MKHAQFNFYGLAVLALILAVTPLTTKADDAYEPNDIHLACDFDELLGADLEEARSQLEDDHREHRFVYESGGMFEDYVAGRITVILTEDDVVSNYFCG